MTPYYRDDWLTILEGDCREVMATMEPESVHCVVTSPPYWGLRDYGTATWVGGDESCDHVRPTGTILGKRSETFHGSNTQEAHEVRYASTCGKCGAIRQDSQLGLEPTPEAYVENMVAVFREVRRVLRADGTVWLNLGDSYSSGFGEAGSLNEHWGNAVGQRKQEHASHRAPFKGLPPKNLVGIPWRVAFALQADGWYLRSDVIWAKPNPMPESVTDRPTKAHEYLFLLSKSPRYYYDADAVREPQADATAERYAAGFKDRYADPGVTGAFGYRGPAGGQNGYTLNPAGRNLRSVWSIATQPYPGAHFATFPEKLVEPCILAGTSAKGVCPECGAPWVREVEREVEFTSGSGRTGHPPDGKNGHEYEQATSGAYDVRMGPSVRTTTTGWRRSCDHGPTLTMADTAVPATVLDPFAGSGTTARVAARLSRRAVLIDLNADYLRQAMKRNHDIPLGLESA